MTPPHLCWMKHIGINAKVASHVFSLFASVEGTTVCLEIPLQSPPPPPGRPSLGDRLPPPPPGRPSRANPGVCKGGGGCVVQVADYLYGVLYNVFARC